MHIYSIITEPLHSLVDCLVRVEFHSLKLAARHISLLIYADNAVDLSGTLIEMRGTCRFLASHRKQESLSIN